MNFKWKKSLILALIVGIGFIHYSCQLYLVHHTQIHNVVLKLFYIPIVLATYWWGLSGGLIIGGGCAIFYGIDVFRFWESEGSENFNDIGEMIVFITVGVLFGWLVDSDRKTKQEKMKAEQRAEVEFRRAILDPLTQAFNRRYMDTILQEFWEKSQKGGESFSLLMIDLNNFKFINDHYGHAMGDRVLISTVQIIWDQIRKTDFIFRYGGDEFLILLPTTSRSRALDLAQKLREEVGKLPFEGPDRSSFTADFSIGLIEHCSALKTVQEMLIKLDESLYRAKKEPKRVDLREF